MHRSSISKRTAAGALGLFLMGYVVSAAAAPPLNVNCGTVNPPAVSTEKSARFTIQADGGVVFDGSVAKVTVRVDVPTQPTSVCVDGNAKPGLCADGILRVNRLRAGKSEPLLCGGIARGETYELSNQFDPWSVLDVAFFGVDASLDPARQARVQRIVEKQTKQLEGSLEKNEPAEASWRHSFTTALAEHPGALPETLADIPDAQSRDAVLAVLAGMHGQLKGFVDDCKLDPKYCAVRDELVKNLTVLDKQLRSDAPSRIQVDTLLAGLRPAPKAPAEPKEYCSAMFGLELLGAKFVKLVAAELPAGNFVLPVTYGAGITEARRNATSPLGVLLNYVPAGQTITTPVRSFETKSPNPADVLGVFASVFFKASAAAIKKAGMPEEVCRRAALDPSGDTLAPYQARGLILPPSGKNARELQICEGDKCATEGPTPSIRNTVTIEPPDRVRLGLLLDFGVNLGRTFGADDRDAFAEPGYVALNGDDDSSEAFTLRYESDVRRNILLSMLIGPRWDCFSIGVGPGLVDASGAAAFRQWNARFGLAIAEDFFFTVGGGIRFIDESESGTPKALVLSHTADTPAKTPTLQTQTGVAWTLGAGVALDLAVLPETGDKLLKSVGVKQ